MKRSAFLFFKGLGLLFAVLCGIGTAVLGWFDGADWMNIVAYSIAVTGLILWLSLIHISEPTRPY